MATYTIANTFHPGNLIGENGREYTLSDLMEFDRVIIVNDDGTVSDAPNVYAPELSQWECEDGIWHETLYGDGWTLLSGYTGQYGYRGPMMHQSEFIGGRMANDILSTPGYYVAIYPSCTDADGNDVEPDSWAVAYRPL